jgi:hypothetical protein
MPNLHNRYISAERKISQKNPEYMLNYSLPCSCGKNLNSFWLTLKQQWTIKISSPLFLLLASRPSWLEVGITGHNFVRGPSKDHSTKVLLQLAQWFLRRRFLCEFPIGSYVKLSSAVGAILVEGPNSRTHFWKKTIQWLFHQNFVVIEQMVSDKKVFMGISHRVLC